MVPGEDVPLAPTHWSFGQLASLVGAPAAFLMCTLLYGAGLVQIRALTPREPVSRNQESFFATLKTELIHRRPWPTKSEARAAIHDYIAAFFNPHRRHSSLGYVSPMDFERQHAAATVAA